MATAPIAMLLARADRWESSLCARLNVAARRRHVRQFFRGISRLGDGHVWGLLAIVLATCYGRAAWRTLLVMAAAGAIGLVMYRGIKSRIERERPFVTFRHIDAGTAPLDRYSFPSGHTLHAVCFTVLATAHFPAFGWALVPLAGLIAASRVVLGLHYPSDVLVGGALGGAIATLGLAVG